MSELILLAIALSIDSLGIGITYGLKNTRISFPAKMILFTISLIITLLSIYIGNILAHLLPSFITNLISATLFILIGLWILKQTLEEKNKFQETSKKVQEKNIYQFFIKQLGITIQIIKEPISSDLDHSNEIDAKEAIFLGIASSIDSISGGIGVGTLKVNSFLAALTISLTQLFFLFGGILLGKKIITISKIPANTWNIISAILLITLGISQLA